MIKLDSPVNVFFNFQRKILMKKNLGHDHALLIFLFHHKNDSNTISGIIYTG